LGKSVLINSSTFERFEENVFFYKNGVTCGVYNRQTTAKLYIECSEENVLSFLRKTGCEYEFLYKTKLACNSFYLNNIQKKMDQFFKEIN
jgi:hypothetical protein